MVVPQSWPSAKMPGRCKRMIRLCSLLRDRAISTSLTSSSFGLSRPHTHSALGQHRSAHHCRRRSAVSLAAEVEKHYQTVITFARNQRAQAWG